MGIILGTKYINDDACCLKKYKLIIKKIQAKKNINFLLLQLLTKSILKRLKDKIKNIIVKNELTNNKIFISNKF